MTGTVAYILAKKIALGAVSGIANITLNDNQLIFEFNDGTSANMTIPLPKDGLSIVGIEIDANKHLICTMSDNSIIDAGELPGGTDLNASVAKKEDIDKIFNFDETVDLNTSTLATKDSIDKLFQK